MKEIYNALCGVPYWSAKALKHGVAWHSYKKEIICSPLYRITWFDTYIEVACSKYIWHSNIKTHASLSITDPDWIIILSDFELIWSFESELECWVREDVGQA